MTTKRVPLNRLRTAPTNAETLALFLELSKVPARRRDSEEFQERELYLHRRLGVSCEAKCSVCSVLDGEPMAGYKIGSPQEDDWRIVRAARLQLLAAARVTKRAS